MTIPNGVVIFYVKYSVNNSVNAVNYCLNDSCNRRGHETDFKF